MTHEHATEETWVPPEDGADDIAKLAALDPMEYDKVRKDEATRLNVRPSTLDTAVKKLRRDNGADARPSGGRALNLPTPEPWPEPVDGAALLDGLTAVISKYVALPSGCAEAMGLWIVHAHAFDCFQISPRLALTSPQKRCGKTTGLGTLYHLVNKPLMAASITPSAVFRTIEAARPCLIIDEADTFLKDNDELRGVLNSGHGRISASVIRTVGDDHEPRQFSVWAPLIIAMIGRLPDTLEDRSIHIQMQRRRPDEPVARLRHDVTPPELSGLASQTARWVRDNEHALRSADPTMPGSLHDRARDNWRPLLAVADLAGGGWPDLARRVALELSDEGVDDASVQAMLLSDIQDIFEGERIDRIASAYLCDKLKLMDDRPWPEWRRGQPITTRQVARLLTPFGIVTSSVRFDDRATLKGYYRKAFNDAFARYTPSPSGTTAQTNPSNGCAVVPDEKGGTGTNARSPDLDRAEMAIAEDDEDERAALQGQS